MNKEPIQFLPLPKFWEEEKRRADQRALWLLIGVAGGTAGTIVIAWIIHLVARGGLTA